MTTGIDLLEQKLLSETDPRSRISLLLEIANKIELNDPQQALVFASEAKTLIEFIQDNTHLGNCLYQMASAQYLLTNSATAMENCTSALLLFQKENKRLEEAKVLNQMALLNEELNHHETALLQYSQALSIYKEQGDVVWQAALLSNIGSLHNLQGNYVQGMKCLFEGLALSRKANQKHHESLILNNIAVFYLSTADYPRALHYQLASLKGHEETNNLGGQCYSLVNIGYLYDQMSNKTKALEILFQTLSLAKSIGYTHQVGMVLLNLASFYVEEGNVSNAIKYFKECISISSGISNHYWRANLFIEIGLFHEKISDLENARLNFSQANQIAKEFNVQEVLYQTELLLIRTQPDFNFDRDTEAVSELITCAERVDNKRLLKEAHDLLSKLFTQSRNKTEGAKQHKLARYYQRQIYGTEQVEQFRALAIQFEIDAALKGAEGFIDESLLRKAVEKNASKLGDPEPDSVLPPPDEPEIIIKTFGDFELYLCGTLLTKEQWQRKKARDLFKYLLIHLGKAIPVDELCDQLWNEMPIEKAVPNLNTTISALRKALEPQLEAHKPSAFLKASDKAYKLELGERTSVDYIRFKNRIALARRAPTVEEKTDLYEAAAALYTGEFLRENLTDDWTFFERESLKEQYIESQLFLSQVAAQSNNLTASMRYAKNILPIDRTFEKAYQLIFRALKESGQESELSKMYAECRKAFRKELAIEPPKSLRDFMK